MIGLPRDLFTKADWLNAVEYARVNGNSRRVMISRLEALKENTTMLVPKKTGVAKLSDGDTSGEDELPEEDFEVVYDPNNEMNRLGFTAKEIKALIGGLK